METGVAKPGFARFSFMGDASGPWAEVLTYNATSREVTVLKGQHRATSTIDNIFTFLDERLKKHKVASPEHLPFSFNLGYVGTFGYELKSETIGAQAYPSRSPDAAFLFATRMVVFDHEERRCHLLHLVANEGDLDQATAWFDSVEARLRCLPEKGMPPPVSTAAQRPRMTLADVEQWIALSATMRHARHAYIEKIAEAQREIVDGESYEICLTNIVEFPFDGSPFDLYCVMRELTPAPHAGYFHVADLHLACASPERFLSVDRGGRVQAKPIKGTRPRGRSVEEDARLIADLSGDEKDRAENLMIVDLLRNDLGQVCELASVQVSKLFDVESYSHVHQLVSTIEGQLRPKVSAVQCVRAAFPGGSMTGAPKKRTMDIIDRLEEGPRGIYSGALGWFGLCGACDFNIVIRSVVVDAHGAYFGVGGAIIALSDAENEFRETLVKARGVVEAIEWLQAAPARMTARGERSAGDVSPVPSLIP
ncbi:para-aminobenzoate synthase, amidotransferase component [Caldimonas brevitalea]|uniref:aminodeoxychorismate synthase n=1 Tax=Caldimonas brevitalea TaxID=413882 RepID=A0A0G3BQ15_9BURK|nr:para-aminobenzoate synthase, amidotransferase component [Caldimonas brevitalea]